MVKKQKSMPTGLLVLNIFLIISIVSTLISTITLTSLNRSGLMLFGMLLPPMIGLIVNIIFLVILTLIVIGFFKAKKWSWHLFIYYMIFSLLAGLTNIIILAVKPQLRYDILSQTLSKELLTPEFVKIMSIFLFIIPVIIIVILGLVTYYAYKKKDYFIN